MARPDEIAARVDQNGNIIDYVEYKTLTDDDMWRIISVWIENDHGQVLLQQRSKYKRFGSGQWTPAVEGTVEENDSFDVTAKREITEEIGLRDFKLIPTSKMIIKGEVGWRLAQGYRLICNWPVEKFSLHPKEVAAIEWVDKQQIIDEISGKTPASRLYPTAAKAWVKLFNL